MKYTEIFFDHSTAAFKSKGRVLGGISVSPEGGKVFLLDEKNKRILIFKEGFLAKGDFLLSEKSLDGKTIYLSLIHI